MRIEDLKSAQLDGIKEIANIGSGHAATALSEMLKSTVMASVPEVKILPLEDVGSVVGGDEMVITSVVVDFGGDFTGRSILVFPYEESMALADLFLPPVPEGGERKFGSMEESFFKEIGNIVICSYLSALGDFLGLIVFPSVPSLVVDSATAVLTSAYMDFFSHRDIIFCVESKFSFVEKDKVLRAYLLLLPEAESLRVMLKILGLE